MLCPPLLRSSESLTPGRSREYSAFVEVGVGELGWQRGKADGHDVESKRLGALHPPPLASQSPQLGQPAELLRRLPILILADPRRRIRSPPPRSRGLEIRTCAGHAPGGRDRSDKDWEVTVSSAVRRLIPQTSGAASTAEDIALHESSSFSRSKLRRVAPMLLFFAQGIGVRARNWTE